MALCPCRVRTNIPEVWDRLLDMQRDEESSVRSLILHALTDGSPRARQAEVVDAIERLARDPDLKLRRRARRALSHFRRTGQIIEV